MTREEASDPRVLRHYEGLVWKTAARYVNFVDEEFEDIQQILRLKVFRALLSYDSSKSSMTQDAYVFSCVVNQCKDLVRKKKTKDKNNAHELLIEEIAPTGVAGSGLSLRDSFESRYLSTTHEQTYSSVEDDEVLIPSTLTETERHVLGLLYLDFKQSEAARILGLGKREMEKTVKAIRMKMADWRPEKEEDQVAEIIPFPSCPLPQATRRAA